MILTLDLEKTLTQTIIIIFSVAFICVTCWVKMKIEGRFRENARKLKNTKTKLAKVKNEEIHLCKKALLVTSNRHHRSIVAASFLQTCEEELEKLQQITDTIKRVQLPTFLQDLQCLSSQNFLPKVDIPVSVPSRNHVEDLEKKLESKGELKPVQFKLLQTRTRSTLTSARRDRPKREKQLYVCRVSICVNAKQ
ncbi:uncharacterized protein LOC124364699 [Homalodisca vitripennis]|uniref:uncharacterized protein LOC124364699 n=1 Tax=Homalodisca vitripennis TaxID=197043 RepID=UPI001EEB6085|nr:uncharacterized protein LOC124364699 [Homalodisca vitripennis]